MPRVASFKKKRIRRSRAVIPRGRRPIKTKSLFPRKEVWIRKGKVRIKKILPTKRRMFRKFHSPFRIGYAFTNFDRRMRVIVRSWLRKQTEWSPVKRKVDYTSSYRAKPFTFKTTRKKGLGKSVSKSERKHTIKRINEQRKHREDRKRVKPERKKDRRGGDTSKFRKYKWYGPKGPLGPHLVISIIATGEFTRALRKEERLRHRGRKIRRNVESAIDGFRSELVEYAKMIIGKYVPIETGDLQNSLIQHLEKGKRRGCNLRIDIATDRDMLYAAPVNRFPEKKIQHSANMGIIGRRSHRLLHDPKAQKGFYNHIRMNISNKAWELLNKMYEQILAATLYSTINIKRLHPTFKKNYLKVKSQPSGSFIRVKEKVVNPRGWTSFYNRDIPKMYSGGRYTTPSTMSLEEKYSQKETEQMKMRERIYHAGAKTVHAQIYKKKDIMGWFVISGLMKRPKKY